MTVISRLFESCIEICDLSWSVEQVEVHVFAIFLELDNIKRMDEINESFSKAQILVQSADW